MTTLLKPMYALAHLMSGGKLHSDLVNQQTRLKARLEQSERELDALNNKLE